jgi:YjbE family integral membrane protein
MDGAAAASSLGVLLQIVFLDLLLGGDNALVIALACRRLPAEQAHRAAWLGAAGAIVFRLILTLMTSWLMKLPFLQLLSALPLLIIAMNLMQEEPQEDPDVTGQSQKSGMLAAASIIILSDAAMSLDNVMALAAVSGGNFWLLAFGLAVSIPMIVFGSFGFSHLMRIFPLLGDIGAAMLGWVAGGMIVGDPLFAAWLKSQAPALELALPLACAIFVLAQGRFARDRVEAPRKAPAATPRPPVAASPVQTAIAKPPPRPVAAVASTAPEEPSQESGDRWMMLGLLALFVVFGLFLTVAVMLPE